MGLNLILVIVGLIICFGGIYFRRVCSGILGFICGALGALAVALVTVGIWHVSDDSTILAVLICGIICATLSAIYYKVCAAISSFLSTFALLTILLALSDDVDSEMVIIIVAALSALVIAALSVKFYDYSFIISSAVVGAFIASDGWIGLMKKCNLEDMLFEISDELATIMVATILLSVLGISVQLRRLQLVGSTQNGSDPGTGITHGHFSQTATMGVQNVSHQATKIWNQANTEKGRGDLLEEILREKLLFIPPIILLIVLPIIYTTIIDNYGGFEYYYWIYNMAYAVSLGTLVYLVLKKGLRLAFLYALVYTVGFTLSHMSTLEYYGYWSTLIYILRYLIIWSVLEILSSIIKWEEIKPIILLITAVLLDSYVLNWLAYWDIYWYFSAYSIAFPVVVFVTVYLLFKM